MLEFRVNVRMLKFEIDAIQLSHETDYTTKKLSHIFAPIHI